MWRKDLERSHKGRRVSTLAVNGLADLWCSIAGEEGGVAEDLGGIIDQRLVEGLAPQLSFCSAWKADLYHAQQHSFPQ